MVSVQPQLVLQAYKSNIGLILKDIGSHYTYKKFDEGYLFNNKKVNPLSAGWYLFDEQEISSIQKKVPAKYVQTGWALDVDGEIQGLGLPKTLSLDDLSLSWDDEQECDVYHGKFTSVGKLYKPVHEQTKESWDEIPFEVQIIREITIDNISNPVEMKVSTYRDGYGISKTEIDLKSVTTWEALESILTPEFLLHERPCSISSENMYKIIRAYINEHLDRSKCKITDDYNFCFAVKRLVKVKPYIVKTEKYKTGFKSYNPPKFINETMTFKEVACFEMTHSGVENGRGYKGYTIIPALKANNLKELSEYLKQYLDDLIADLNSTVVECEHCNGTGHIVHQLKHPKGSV